MRMLALLAPNSLHLPSSALFVAKQYISIMIVIITVMKVVRTPYTSAAQVSFIYYWKWFFRRLLSSSLVICGRPVMHQIPAEFTFRCATKLRIFVSCDFCEERKVFARRWHVPMTFLRASKVHTTAGVGDWFHFRTFTSTKWARDEEIGIIAFHRIASHRIGASDPRNPQNHNK